LHDFRLSLKSKVSVGCYKIIVNQRQGKSIKKLLTACPFKSEVVNTAENRVNDLMEDLVAILTAFSTRLYGQRRGRQKTRAAFRALQESE
jgi:predicted site-specific integrase-resolvase